MEGSDLQAPSTGNGTSTNNGVSSGVIFPSHFRFLDLPSEVKLLVGAYCDNQTLGRLATTCRQVYQVFYQTGAGIWRDRFNTTFDILHFTMPANSSYREMYIRRHAMDTPFTITARANSTTGSLSPQILVGLINECEFNGPYFVSKNLTHLRKVLAGNPLLDAIGLPSGSRPWSSKTWAVVQLTLLHLVLDLSRGQIGHCFQEAAVFAFGNPDTTALFNFNQTGRHFHKEVALGILNFFKLFICWPGHDLRVHMEELAPIERPQPWYREFAHDGFVRNLGMCWRGVIASIDAQTVENLRLPFNIGLDPVEVTFPSCRDDELPQLFITFDPSLLPSDDFPRMVIEMLNPYGTTPPRSRRNLPEEWENGKQYSLCVGTLRSCGYTQLVVGCLTPVRGQDGIEGWQRLVMVAYDDPAPDTSLNSNLAGYCAVQLPGGANPTTNTRSRTHGREECQESDIEDDGIRVELGRYGAPAGSFAATQARRPSPFDTEEEEELGEGPYCEMHRRNDDFRQMHRDFIQSNITGEASRYWGPRAHLVPQLASDLMNDDQSLGFEGLVLPGGNAIVGRWWDLEDDEVEWVNEVEHLDQPEVWRRNSGPAVFWNVDLGLSYQV